MTPNSTLYEGNITQGEVNTSSFPPNSTAAVTDATPVEELSQLYLILTTLFFSFVIVVGLVGNSLIVATLSRWSEMRTPCNLLIANICAADLGVCVLAAPLRIIEIYRGWLFDCNRPGEASRNCSTIQAEDDPPPRQEGCTRGLDRLLRDKRCSHANLSQEQLVPGGYYFCFPIFNSDGYKIAYEMYLVVLFITLPLVLQSAAYLDVIRALRAKDEIQTRRNSFQLNTSMKKIFNDRIRQTKRLVRMLIVLMLVFQACYLPRGVIMLMEEFTPETTAMPEFIYVQLITLAIYYLKHVINPLILAAMSNDFRPGCLSVCSVKRET
ncbi:Substance-K receptor [Desmophyllum pertusum]|uniref:Substance-K receptor n=1 Tax=Desmophyllum pertusum TaxID=174260 RepID=A0A9W9ZQ99_9CNID|nr:Substance-K receptor [Desmophyllum pertusum]